MKAGLIALSVGMAFLTGCSSQPSASTGRAQCLYAYVRAYQPGWSTDDTYTLPECKELSGADRAILRTQFAAFLQKLGKTS